MGNELPANIAIRPLELRCSRLTYTYDMVGSCGFIIEQKPTNNHIKDKWALVKCNYGGRSVMVKCTWPINPNELMIGMQFKATLSTTYFKGVVQMKGEDVKPADVALFGMVLALKEKLPKLCRKLDKLMKETNGNSLIAATTDLGQLSSLLSISERDANSVLKLCGQLRNRFTGSNACIPSNMRDDLSSDDLDVIKENPYHLYFLGLQNHSSASTLRVADEIAQAVGLLPSDANRVNAYVHHTLNAMSDETGSYWHTPGNVVSGATTLMTNTWAADTDLEPMLLNNLAVCNDYVEVIDGMVSAANLASIEIRLASLIVSLIRRGPPPPDALRLARSILAGDCTGVSPVCCDVLLKLDTRQREAVLLALSEPITIITGHAGTGKSSVLAAIERLIREVAPPKRGRVDSVTDEKHDANHRTEHYI